MRTEPPTGDDLTRMLVTMKQRVLDEAAHDPAPARRRARNRAIITSTAILLTLGLGAGAAIAAGIISDDDDPIAQPKPTPTAAAAPSPTPRPFEIETAPPVDPLTTVTEIVVRPERLDLHDADGALVTSVSYDAEATEFVGTLETVFGVAPEQSWSDGTMETPPFTRYRWDGFVVADHEEQWLTDDVPEPNIYMNLRIQATAAIIGDGVTVRTVDGFGPGDDVEALAAQLDQAPTLGDRYFFPVETGDPLGDRPSGSDLDNAYSVGVTDVEGYGASSTIFAPYNFGVGGV
ncbi:hypothetical protein [Agromyces arachidis]|uniref:hypothetical protein n=1 Tax=Agromyces arachidis TaxID=766966 RepID=UPI0040570924